MHGLQPIEPCRPILGSRGDESVKGQGLKGKSRGDRGRQRCTRSRHRIDTDSVLPTRLNECNSRISDTRSPGVADQGNLCSGVQPREELGYPRAAVVFVKANGRRRNRVMIQKFRRSASVFGSNQVYLPHDPERPKCDVLEVADGRGDDEQRAGHRAESYCTIARCALTEPKQRAPVMTTHVLIGAIPPFSRRLPRVPL